VTREKRGIFIAGLILVAIGGVACGSKIDADASTSAPASQAAKIETDGNANSAKADATETVEVDQNMMANLHVEQVHEQALRRLLTATGKVQFNEDRTARVLAPLPGQVQDLTLRVGDTVQKDQVIFSIKSREVASLVTDYLESQRDLDLAAKTHTMTQDLFDHQASSRIALQQSESDLAKAQAHVARAEEALRILGLDPAEAGNTSGLRALIPVLAPLAGNIIERTVTTGQFVQADSTPLLTIAELSSVWVLVDIFESDIRWVHPGQKVQVTAAAYPDRRFTATLERISDKVDPDTRTLKVRLLVSNPGLLLKPEMFISASLELNETTNGVTVPAKALLFEDDKRYIFVMAGDRRFERRQVSAASDESGRVRVTSGLRTGDRVVTDGALLLSFRQQQSQN
jgi:cobalt-zinc-cadmium efflux system membrane fusion protein